MKLKIILLLMSICPMLQSQDKVTYGYDAAGNRISRTIIFSPRSAPIPVEEEQPAVYFERLSDIQLKIYPNPTTGLLTVEISNLPEGETATIRLYAMSGQLISTFNNISHTVNIDISSQPAGIYLMNIVAGEYRTEWKIIKK